MSSYSDSHGTALELVTTFDREIKPGTYIPPEYVETALGIKRTHADYSTAVITLRHLLEAHLEAKNGRMYMTRMSKKGIRILTTAESVSHGHSTFEAKKRAMEYWHHKTQVVVDPHIDELTDSEKERYKDQQLFNARMLLHMKESELEGNVD
jgi:hypothetical protein